ncbi:PREDICTED: B3 domain-containing protein REM8-like isoform X2 [Camelina sativa]|uniref:B3 domain-containing protein REM8-like isoform X2 n=1 Tax=Camelina sativa TaxID=90675 RepID=A0ABM0UWV4_CAMSA|nr:PREDICTED: B3 domain-containing protein REM8-like isoform X2 [Camelina sativa]
MENPSSSLFSPKNPHFFQPLLPGFKSQIKIHVKFFSKHIKGKQEGKIVKLRSDSWQGTWKIKMEGHTLTNGWKEFVEAHDLRVGDFVVFRHERDMLFHVTAFEPSCCEVQYAQSLSHNEIGESSRKEKEIEENVKTEPDLFSSDLTCFSQSVTASNLSRDFLGVPRDVARRYGLDKGRHEVVLMNEEGKSWESEVKSYKSGQVFIFGGWKSLCTENRLEVGDPFTFKLLHNAERLVFLLCSRTEAGPNRFVKLTPTPNSLHLGKQQLPVSFMRENMLDKPGNIILVDKDKVEWLMKLECYRKGSRMMMYISSNGWKSFCAANEVGAGESLTLELIRGGTSPLLMFVSKMELSPVEAEARPHKRARVQIWSKESERLKHDVRQKIAAEGEPSRRTRSSSKSTGDQENPQHTQSCSILDHLPKVRQSIEETLTSIRRFRAKLETKEQTLEALLHEIENYQVMM